MNARSILVVEDSSEHRELIAALLEPAGIEVSFAHNAEQAFAQLKTARPHLILMDILLPGMSGLDLTSELRRTSVLDDVGIVALTALAMSGDEETARSAGCDGYITKPINIRTFSRLIRHLLDHSRGEMSPFRV